VSEAVDGEVLEAGHAYVAPGNRHLLVVREAGRYVARLSDGPPVNRHRPSVDVLFRSVAQCAGPNAIGVILTGMGDDGARGLLELLEAGARTMAQDEATSVVWGMPGEAVKRNAAEQVLPLPAVADRLHELALGSRVARPAPPLAAARPAGAPGPRTGGGPGPRSGS
jgi:two-component system chemotaxis response regulator CheB